MSLYKRNRVYWIAFTAPNGKRIRRSSGTSNRAQAQELHDRLKAELWRLNSLDEKPRRLWQEAVERWLMETNHKASHENDKIHLRILHGFLGSCFLDEITIDLIEKIKLARKKQDVTNATVNRGLEILRAILKRAHLEWEWIDKIPKVRLLPEPKKRIRWLTQEEAALLLKELPKHLKVLAKFSLATGLRMSNVTGLEWSQVDINRKVAWIHPDQAKTKQAIAVPLNTAAMEVIHEQLAQHPRYVFSYHSKPIKQANTRAWRSALKRAGIENFRWHDLRHTWASWHVQNGTPLHVLKELGGWNSMDMVQRYAHLAAEHTAPFADNANFVTNLSQGENKEKEGSKK